MTDYGRAAETWTARHWPAIRGKGRTRFIVVRGVLAWGGMMFVASLVAVWLMRDSLAKSLPELAAVSAVLCVASGLAWGAATWHLNEKIFRQLPSSKSTPQR